eukprot:TRINITY_DN2760_c0_g1_i1.p2 TRINITY_DN2760_c0_g1~~TRINITY_DN2760_c0_g1_i1.p2  ORF type:complete len:136 (-),score=12.65 TRINITY_DN2760_c0_g1_i1:58-465(-)
MQQQLFILLIQKLYGRLVVRLPQFNQEQQGIRLDLNMMAKCGIVYIIVFNQNIKTMKVDFSKVVVKDIEDKDVIVDVSHVLCVDTCLLYTSDAADDMQCVDLGGRRIIKKKKKAKTCPSAQKHVITAIESQSDNI